MELDERRRLRNEVYAIAAAHNVMAAYWEDDLDKIIGAVANDIDNYLKQYAAELFFNGNGPNDMLAGSEIAKIGNAIRNYWGYGFNN